MNRLVLHSGMCGKGDIRSPQWRGMAAAETSLTIMVRAACWARDCESPLIETSSTRVCWMTWLFAWFWMSDEIPPEPNVVVIAVRPVLASEDTDTGVAEPSE